MKQLIREEPVGFVSAIRMSLLAVLAVAVLAGWRPAIEDVTGTIVAIVAALEGWTLWWARSAVTPEVKVAEKVADAEQRAHVDGYRQAEDDVARLDATRLDPTPARGRRR